MPQDLRKTQLNKRRKYRIRTIMHGGYFGILVFFLMVFVSSLILMELLVQSGGREIIQKIIEGNDFFEEEQGGLVFILLCLVVSVSLYHVYYSLVDVAVMYMPVQDHFAIFEIKRKQSFSYSPFDDLSLNPVSHFFFENFYLPASLINGTELAFENSKDFCERNRLFQKLTDYEAEVCFSILDNTEENKGRSRDKRTGFFVIFECFDQGWMDFSLGNRDEYGLTECLAQYLDREKQKLDFEVVQESIEQVTLHAENDTQLLFSSYKGRGFHEVEYRVFRLDVWINDRCFSVQAGCPNPKDASYEMKIAVTTLFNNLSIKSLNSLEYWGQAISSEMEVSELFVDDSAGLSSSNVVNMSLWKNFRSRTRVLNPEETPDN